jgi:hypothetical protein
MKGLHLAEIFEYPGVSAGKPLAGQRHSCNAPAFRLRG